MEPSLKDMLNVAIDAAHLAGQRTLGYFNAGTRVERKSDNTPVTIADREAETLIREKIGRFFPGHTIAGEEHGTAAGNPDYVWHVDPIDGTKSFIHGVPLFAVLVGVEVRRRACIGVIYLPALDQMLTAADGTGCHLNGRRVGVSEVASLGEATLLTSDVTMSRARGNAYDRLAGSTRLQRTWGDAYGYFMVATGRAEIMLDAAMSPWDCGPLPAILREAGGRFTSWAGEETIHGGDAVATNAQLHEQVLAELRKP